MPARIVGVQIAKPADMTGRRDKLAATALAGLVSGIICTPPYVISRVGEGLLGSGSLFAFGVALIVIGLTLEAGATGAVKAIKVSAKLLAGRYPQTPGDQASAGLDDACPAPRRPAVPADPPAPTRSIT